MIIVKKDFPEILPDNEEIYFLHLFGILESIDELCSLSITKLPAGYAFRISPSIPMYSENILKEIIKFHNIFKIHLDFSKSIKSSGSIVFKIKSH